MQYSTSNAIEALVRTPRVFALVALHLEADGKAHRQQCAQHPDSPPDLAICGFNTEVRVSTPFTHPPASIRELCWEAYYKETLWLIGMRRK